MVAENPSLRVVCKPEVVEAVEALAKASGRSRSGVVAGLLEQIAPKLKELASAIESVNAVPVELGAAIGRSLDQAASIVRKTPHL